MMYRSSLGCFERYSRAAGPLPMRFANRQTRSPALDLVYDALPADRDMDGVFDPHSSYLWFCATRHVANQRDAGGRYRPALAKKYNAEATKRWLQNQCVIFRSSARRKPLTAVLLAAQPSVRRSGLRLGPLRSINPLNDKVLWFVSLGTLLGRCLCDGFLPLTMLYLWSAPAFFASRLLID